MFGFRFTKGFYTLDIYIFILIDMFIVIVFSYVLEGVDVERLYLNR